MKQIKKGCIILAICNIIGSKVFSQTNTFPASGSAGIGTISPLGDLHIKSDNSAQLLLQKTSAGGALYGIQYSAYSTGINDIAGLKINQASGEFRLYTTPSYFPTIYIGYKK